MSLIADALPTLAGSWRQGSSPPAGFSSRQDHSWKYSTWTWRTRPDPACEDHVPRLPYHGVKREGIGHAEDQSRIPLEGHQGLGLVQARRQGLVADDVDARLEEGTGDVVVGVVGRTDGNCIDAVRAGCFMPRHGAIVVVDAVVGQEPVPARCPGCGRIGRERSCDDVPPVGETSAGGVPSADLATAPAADEAKPQSTIGPGIGLHPRLPGCHGFLSLHLLVRFLQ